ncbi:hypothetical protein RHMOL_Rhmol12G0054100 [Rhododendron molle]|uniref:Uncharacterized protein n=1 Tax=Rhododendron molle TaxID=49168 RepID=A0ACC0LF55_RHOML|nr:hypothetical protein RHMOL_Rhmol12G0054100 [Rhododendron molle]
MAQRLNKAENNEINEAESNEINEKATSLRNELNLDGAMGKCSNWTPLHAAASSGKEELFRRLLKSSPELAEAQDSQQRTLLHFASANGYIEIVKAVTKEWPEMCLARDRDGANPLHVAAMRGKVEVLDELLQANTHAARAYKVDRGERETILHLCIKYNQLPFLKMLLKKYFKGKEFVNAKDNAGNTILHLAVADRRFEIVDHVLTFTEIDVNAINESKQTAKDILLLGRQKGKELEREDKLIQYRLELSYAHRGQDGVLDPTEIAEKRNGIIVAAVLMATLAFQAGVAPPGGVWPDDKDGHKSGKAVMASNYPLLYLFFLCCNIVGFVSSVGTLVLIMTDLPFKPGRYWLWTTITKIATISSIAIAYFISIFAVSPLLQKRDRRTLSLFGIIEGVIVLTLAASFIAFLIVIVKAKRERREKAAWKLFIESMERMRVERLPTRRPTKASVNMV